MEPSAAAPIFDLCFRLRQPTLAHRIDQVSRNETALDEMIDVYRVDNAYFVFDGHKRVSIAKAQGREFMDARISHAPTPYRFDPDVDPVAIERTAAEQRFRKETGWITCGKVNCGAMRWALEVNNGRAVASAAARTGRLPTDHPAGWQVRPGL